MSVPHITAKEFLGLLLADENLQILDVRTQAEHHELRLNKPHELLPVQTFDPDNYMGIKDQPVYILCAKGMRAQVAADKMAAAGFAAPTVITGGLTEFVTLSGAQAFLAQGA